MGISLSKSISVSVSISISIKTLHNQYPPLKNSSQITTKTSITSTQCGSRNLVRYYLTSTQCDSHSSVCLLLHIYTMWQLQPCALNLKLLPIPDILSTNHLIIKTTKSSSKSQKVFLEKTNNPLRVNIFYVK